MWQGVKEDVRDSIWIGRPVYDKFGRKGEIISDMWGALDGSTQFNYRVWVIRLDAGGTIQVENAVNFGVPQPFDESGILYFDGDNWVALSEHPDTAYGISLKQAEFPNVSGHPDYQAVLKDDSWLRQPVVKPLFEPAKDGTISLENLLDMARRNTKIFGDLSNQSVACLEPIHEWLDKNRDERMSHYTEMLNHAKDNSDLGDFEFYETASKKMQTAYDHNKHLLKQHSKLACDIFQAFITNVEDEYANPENYDWFCRESWPQRTRLAPSSPCPPVSEFLGYYVANEGAAEIVNQWFEYGTADFIEEYIMNQYQIPAEQQDLDVDMDFHDERDECYELLRLIEDYCEHNLEEIVFEAYYGDEASDMLKEFREQHYEAETFFGEITTEPMTVYRRMGWKQYYDGLEMGYLHPMKTRMQLRPDENIGGTWGMGQPQIWAARKPIFSSPLKHLSGSEAKQLFEIDIPIGTRIADGWSGVQIFDSIPIENVRPFYIGNEEEYTYLAETFQADQFGTSSLEGFAYYDRLPDLGNPKTINSDVSNIAAPFAVVFDNKGVRSIANVGIKENQMQLGGQMTLAHSKSNMSYFIIYLRPMQVKEVETMWYKSQYCELYDYLKEIALTEEGAFGGKEGEVYPLKGSIKDKSWKHNVGAWFVAKDIRAIEALMSIDCEDEDDEEPSLLGLFNWFNRFSAETFHASLSEEFKQKPYWERQILLDYPDERPNRSRDLGYNETRKCAKCAKYGLDFYGAKVSQYNDGLRIYQYDECGCWIYDHTIRNRRYKKVSKLRSRKRQEEYREQQLEKQELERYREQQRKAQKKWWQFWK